MKYNNHITTIEDLKNFLKNFFENKEVKIYLFGSRAKGNNSEHSDIDLAIYSEKDLSEELTLLNEFLENSNLPFKVDLIELKKAPYLEKTIKKEGIRWS